MKKLPEFPKYTLYWLMKTCAEAFRDQPIHLAKIDGKNFSKISYGDFYHRVKCISYGLMSFGMKKGDAVGLIADVGHRWLLTSMGITNVGGVDVPRGTDATSEDLSYIFNHAACSIIFLEHRKAYDKIAGLMPNLKDLRYIIFFNYPGHDFKAPDHIKVITLEELMAEGSVYYQEKPKLFDEVGAKIHSEDLATIIYTSGTTGKPKGVMLTHMSLSWEAEKLSDHLIATGFKPRGDEATMGFLPPWHIGERIFETSILRIGASIAFTNVLSLVPDLKTINPTLLFSVPRVWENFYNKILENLKTAPPMKRTIFNLASKAAISYSTHIDNLRGTLYKPELESGLQRMFGWFTSLFMAGLLFVPRLLSMLILRKVKHALGTRVRFAFSGAGALPYHIDRFFYSIGIPILETYGMTETTGVSCIRSFRSPEIGTLGPVLDGVTIKLMNEKGDEEITEPNVKGVAWHRGNHVMKGYYKEPEKTKAVLNHDGWMNSGDILVRTPKGLMKFAGRAKDTIVLMGGENVEPEPIEFALVQSEFIHQAMVVGQDKKTLGVLIVPAFEKVEKHLASIGKHVPDAKEDWNDDVDVQNLFKNEIKKRVSFESGFKAFEKLSSFYILPKEFEPGKELTQTMKLRRNVMFEMYAQQIEGMYE